MWKTLFPFTFTPPEAPRDTTGRTGAVVSTTPAVQPPPVSMGLSSFEEIYRGTQAKSSRVAYTILKVAEMAESPHLEGMSSEGKRCSLLMALDAAGVEVEDLLQDAMVRQRALNDYEEAQQSRLHDFEGVKIEENRKIQAELDRVTAQHISRIQANLDEVARQQDLFRAWQKQKNQEARRISDAAAICVPQNTSSSGDTLTMMLERAALPKR